MKSLWQNHAKCILALWAWLGLEEEPQAIAHLKDFLVRTDANDKWRQSFTAAELATLEPWATGPLAGGSE